VKAEVRLFASLSEYLPPGSQHGAAILDVPEGSTVSSVARALGIPDEMPSLVLVNERDADLGHRLEPGDVLTMFPALAGGV
jgi:molybdopterin converting factor small subunit